MGSSAVLSALFKHKTICQKVLEVRQQRVVLAFDTSCTRGEGGGLSITDAAEVFSHNQNHENFVFSKYRKKTSRLSAVHTVFVGVKREFCVWRGLLLLLRLLKHENYAGTGTFQVPLPTPIPNSHHTDVSLGYAGRLHPKVVLEIGQLHPQVLRDFITPAQARAPVKNEVENPRVGCWTQEMFLLRLDAYERSVISFNLLSTVTLQWTMCLIELGQFNPSGRS